jgi:hypothetical protein
MDGTGYAVIWLKELRSREKWMRGEHNIRLKHCIPDLRTASDRAVGVVPRYRNREVLRPSPLVSRTDRTHEGEIIMRTQRLIPYAFATCLVLLVTGSALAADNALLKGTYRFVSHLSNVGNTSHLYFNGLITYDGHGNATMTDSGTIIDGNNTSPPFSFEEMGMGTYAVKPNGSFTQEMSFASNPVGEWTLTGVKWVGQIGAQGSVLIISGTIPPQPQTFTTGGVSSVRFGGFTLTAVRIRHE